MDNKNGKEWDLEITARSKALEFNFKEIWRYRDLMLLFVKRDFIAQYKQTILGPVWHVIQPVLTTVMYLLIFNRIARIPTDGINPTLFYLSGITMWSYFSQCLTHTANTFIGNSSIFGKVYFPRMVLPISVVISNLIRLGIQFALLFIAIVWFDFHGYPLTLSFLWLLLPVLVALIGCIGLGLGIIISSLTTKYRDLSVLLTFGVQIGMYATPIVYPLSYVKGKGYEWIIGMNPLTPLLEVYRYILFGKGTFDLYSVMYTLGFTVFILFAGVMIFNKVEKSFMDTV